MTADAHRRAWELMRAGRHGEALAAARAAVAGLDRCTAAHGLLAMLLVNRDAGEEALAVIAAARALPGADAAACDGLAFASLRLGRHEDANALYRRAAQLAPRDAGVWYNLAASERALGRLDAAGEACDAAIACDPGHGASYLLRAELQVQTADRNHVAQLREALAHMPAGARERVALGYALAKELDDLGDPDAAFAAFADAAAARRRAMAYDVAGDVAKLKRIAEVFDGPFDRRWSHDGDPVPHLFIVGLPRSGTTLLERMLSGLPGVASNGETDQFAQALLRAVPAGAQGDIFARAAQADPLAVGRDYAAHAGRAEARTVIEKLPMNYLYLGAIRRALPDAALLVLRRPPLDAAFAMYRTLFGEAYPFSYDVEDLARYVAAYTRLMAHWRARLGDALHEIRYADLVTDPAATGAGAAAQGRLAWDAGATAIERNSAASLTASAAQIRRPIYRTSLEKTRLYRRHLEPLAQALRRHGIADPEAD